MKKVLLFACIEKNIGDDLFIKTIAERYKDVSFSISSAAQYGSLAHIKNLSFDNNIRLFIDCSNSEPRTPFGLLKRFVKIQWLKKRLGKFDCAIYVVGNAFKNNEYRGKYQSRWIRDRLKVANQFYLISSNFGPYNDERWRDDFISIFTKMNDVCFRDYNSYLLFQDLSTVRYAPDVIFSLGRIRKDNVEKKRVLISAIDCSLKGRPEYLSAYTDKYETQLANIANYYIRNDYEIVFLNSNSIQDAPATDRIISRLDSLQGVIIEDYDGDLERVLGLFQDVDFAIATRLHVIILSLLYGVPVIPIVYDMKVEGVLNSCGFNEGIVNLDSSFNLSVDDVVSCINSYNYSLPSTVIDEANKQFAAIDKALS